MNPIDTFWCRSFTVYTFDNVVVQAHVKPFTGEEFRDAKDPATV